MKKFLALLLPLLLVIGAAGCAQQTQSPQATSAPTATPVQEAPAEKTLYQAGTYTATTRGRNADLTVSVTFSDSAITAIEVLSHEETPGIGDMPIERLPKEIIEYQSLAVDAVASATITSEALLAAVEDCVRQAGGDVDALKAVVIEKEAGELVTRTADVIVIGGGGAGLAAAVAAGENGASVVVVEKTAGLGGNTKLALGLLNAADPERQASLVMSDALKDTVQEYLDMEPHDDAMAGWQATVKTQFEEYLASGSTSLFDSPEFHMIQTYVDGDYYGNPVMIEALCSNALDTVHWLTDHGLQLAEKTKTAQGVLWQRAHQATEYKSGLAFVDTFVKSIERESLPVEIVYEVRAGELIVENGRVTGVKGTDANGTPYEFYGTNGVVLATGGFGANVEMRQKYNSIWATLDENVPTSNSPAITGDGIVMAEAAGANLVGMDKIQLLPVADPVTGETNTRVGNGTSPYINKEGVRFVAEDERRDVMAAAILEQTDSVCWLISSRPNSELDENDLNAYGLSLDYLLETGKVYMADTLEELAVQIDLDPQTLVDTINKFNEAFDKGYDEEFGRTVFDPNSRISEGPYFACLRAPAVHHTMGGVEIDPETHVYSTSGEIIPGLYAAGEVTGGIHGGNRLGGNAIADAMTFGRIAGQNAAAKN